MKKKKTAIKPVKPFKIKEKKVEYAKHGSNILYWMSLLVLTICNFFIAIILIPLLIFINQAQLYLIVVALGLVFGFFFNLLIHDIEHLERKHHLFAILFIPLVVIIDLFIVINISNNIATIFGISTKQSPLIVSCVYVLVFLIPYIFTRAKKENF